MNYLDYIKVLKYDGGGYLPSSFLNFIPDPEAWNYGISTPLPEIIVKPSKQSSIPNIDNFVFPKNENASAVYNTLIDKGLDPKTAAALTIHSGGESGWKTSAINNIGAEGLGGWLGESKHSVLNYINSTYNKNYENISDSSLLEQADALKWFYYDLNKQQIDEQNGTYNKALLLLKYGFSPVLAKNKRLKWNGMYYTDTPGDWLRFINNTGNNLKGKWQGLDHMLHGRLNYSGIKYKK